MGHLKDKVALVTGAGSGIGRASALAFSKEGAKVAVADIDAAGGETTVDLIKNAGGEAIFIMADVTQAAEVETMVNKVIQLYGALNCAFNNAGIEGTPLVATADLTEETWDSVIDINLKGVWLCLKYEIPQMLKQGNGAIVNSSSVAGLQGSRFGGAAYGASKFGIIGLTKTAALEYASQGIRINAVCPGVISTPMLERLEKADPQISKKLNAAHPIGRMGRPEEIAEAVTWLCSDKAAFVTGHAMAIDGGFVS